jgi:hypothetical protein
VVSLAVNHPGPLLGKEGNRFHRLSLPSGLYPSTFPVYIYLVCMTPAAN